MQPPPASAYLDDRFHETGTHGTGDLVVDSSFGSKQTRSGIMARWRHAVELALTDDEIKSLGAIARSRSDPARRVERARMLLVYRENFSFFAVGQRLGVHHQTVERCVERAVAYGALAALDDRPRPGKEPTITLEAKTWLVSLACDKAKEHGYPHELWTTRLLARHARENAPAAGHACLANLAQGTVCKILGQEETMSKSSMALTNLRAFVILLVIAFHSVLAYLGSQPTSPPQFDSPPYWWRAIPIINPARWFGFHLFAALTYLYLMQLMFFLSGLFVCSC